LTYDSYYDGCLANGLKLGIFEKLKKYEREAALIGLEGQVHQTRFILMIEGLKRD